MHVYHSPLSVPTSFTQTLVNMCIITFKERAHLQSRLLGWGRYHHGWLPSRCWGNFAHSSIAAVGAAWRSRERLVEEGGVVGHAYKLREDDQSAMRWQVHAIIFLHMSE